MTKVLVTGGAGFIGSHIVDLLIENNYEVTVIDDLSTGHRENLNKDATFYEMSICSQDLREIFEKEKPDLVVHQAAQINVRKSLMDPKFDEHVNIHGSINVLECCKGICVDKIVYASSGGAIYGNPQYLPVDEKHSIKPLSPYGISKHTVEHYLYLYKKLHNLDYISLRYSNVYGPRQDYKGEAGVIAIFTDRLLNEKNPIIFGDGEQTRDFIFVEDVANATLLAMKKDTTEREINIGTGIETSVNGIYNKLKNITNKDIEAIYSDPIEGEVRRICLNPTLAEKELRWQPLNTLEEGLKKTVEWFRNRTE